MARKSKEKPPDPFTSPKARTRNRFYSGVVGAYSEGYSEAQAEFLRALEKFKNERHQAFPTACEYMDVLLSLGYRKPVAEQAQNG